MLKEQKSISGYALILNYLGIFSVLIGFLILSPLILLFFRYQEITHAIHFISSAGMAFLFGVIILVIYRGKTKTHLSRNHDAVLVVATWILAIIFSAFPFYFSGQLTFTQSIFEATSGYSTTGLTVIVPEETPHMFLLFRSLMQLFGGVGLVLLLTSFVSDRSGVRLYNAEGHGDKLVPNLLRSARMILSIYLSYILLGIIFYVIFGMPIFDAINHSISAVATGGFSVRSESIGYYNSLPIEIVTIVLMLLGGTNFFVHLLIMKRKFNLVFKHAEVKFLGILSLIFVPIFIYSLMRFNLYSFGEASRVGIFHFVSTITTTGLQTIPSVTMFHSSLIYPMLALMMIGAGMGSTAGGIKLYRAALGLKSVHWHLHETIGKKKTIRPHFMNRLGNKVTIDKDEINQNYTFIMVYFIIILVGTFIFTLDGYGLTESLFEFTSTLGTIGLSYGIIGSNPSNLILWTTSFGMLIARLESFIIIIAISKLIIDFKQTVSKRN